MTGAYLLDTHAAIWFFIGDNALSPTARRIIRDGANPAAFTSTVPINSRITGAPKKTAAQRIAYSPDFTLYFGDKNQEASWSFWQKVFSL